MKAGDIIARKDGKPIDGKYETVRVGSVVHDTVWIEDLQGWFPRDKIMAECHVVDHEGRPRNIPGRWHNINPDEFERMAAAAFDVKNSMTRQGVGKAETVRQMAAAMKAELERC